MEKECGSFSPRGLAGVCLSLPPASPQETTMKTTLRPSAFLGWYGDVPIGIKLTDLGQTSPQQDPTTGESCERKIYEAMANWH